MLFYKLGLTNSSYSMTTSSSSPETTLQFPLLHPVHILYQVFQPDKSFVRRLNQTNNSTEIFRRNSQRSCILSVGKHTFQNLIRGQYCLFFILTPVKARVSPLPGSELTLYINAANFWLKRDAPFCST